jgi:hypothetical protein
MSKPIDPNAQYRVKLHVANGYKYASTQPSQINPETGAKRFRHIHWGTVDDQNKFTPGQAFFRASREDRAKLIFPADWDLGDARLLIETPNAAADGQDLNADTISKGRLYGDVWLLEQIAIKTGIRRDLDIVFDENKTMVDGIMTLAMFQHITNYKYNRLSRWQRIVKSPSELDLSPS